MEPVVGIFASREAAERAAGRLRESGIHTERINLLWPGVSEARLHAGIPTSDTEGQGVAPALGGVVGAVAGGTAGMGLGAAVASLLIPGVGAVSAIGLAAAALFGTAGGLGGAAAGHKLDEKANEGIPKDDVYVYEDALRRGHSIVFVLADSDEDAGAAGRILLDSGAESLDAARERWWKDIRDGERLHAQRQGRRFEEIEPIYRRGFEAAQHPEARERTYKDAPDPIRRRHSEVWNEEPFRSGYERGCDWARERAQILAEAPPP